MEPLRITTTRAIHDAMALRGLENGATFIRSASPEQYMSEARLRAAREVLRNLPLNAATMNQEKLIDKMMPVVLRCRIAMPDTGRPPAGLISEAPRRGGRRR